MNRHFSQSAFEAEREEIFSGLPDIPALNELRTRRQWVAWRYLERDGNITKPPVNPHNGFGASHSDPATWGTYEEAAKWAREHGLPGVGYVLTDDDDITGADLDDCRDDDFGSVETWANEIIALAETYTEISPSGRGLRLIWRGKIDKTIKCDPARVEVYKHKRYLTITGNHLAGTPQEIRPAPLTERALQARAEQFKPAPQPAPEMPPRKPNGIISAALAQRSPNSGGDFFRSVNTTAMQNLGRWVPDLFGSTAEFQAGTGAWRVSSRNLGRQLQEDLSIAPSGIVDFGVADMGDPRLGKRTPIDLVLEFGGKPNAAEAALWLCDRCGVDPTRLGWRGEPKLAPPEEESLTLPPLTIAEWKGREDLAEPDFLLGHFLTTTSRVLLTATTGLGKTNFCMAVAIRIAGELGFLHWRARRRARVLYIDGEMSRRLFRERIQYECARAGVEPDTVFFLSKEDVEGMPPLNTPEGQAYIDAFIKRIGGVDLIIFDNIMCLLIGDMKDPAPWQAVANWTKSLTKRCIGQIWVHHTGHDETRSYGDKSKEWALDTTIHLDAKKRDDTDVSFTLKFGKARERTPATRDDFRDIDICLLDDEWTHEAAVIEKKKPAGWTKGLKLVRRSIDEAILAHGFKHRARGDGPEVAAVALKHARNAHKKIYVNTGDDEATGAERQAWSSNFKKARSSDLVGGETLADGREIIWIVREN